MNLGADHDHPRHPETAVSRWWPEYHCSYPLVFYPLELVKIQLEVCPFLRNKQKLERLVFRKIEITRLSLRTPTCINMYTHIG